MVDFVAIKSLLDAFNIKPINISISINFGEKRFNIAINLFSAAVPIATCAYVFLNKILNINFGRIPNGICEIDNYAKILLLFFSAIGYFSAMIFGEFFRKRVKMRVEYRYSIIILMVAVSTSGFFSIVSYHKYDDMKPLLIDAYPFQNQSIEIVFPINSETEWNGQAVTNWSGKKFVDVMARIVDNNEFRDKSYVACKKLKEYVYCIVILASFFINIAISYILFVLFDISSNNK